jgi:predicted RNA polymerase sigma factor
MTYIAWIEATFSSSRPQAVAALLRYFRDLDTAEEAFQEACLRALKAWPKNGPPRDPTAWLIFVGRNAAIDQVRKASRHTELPPDEGGHAGTAGSDGRTGCDRTVRVDDSNSFLAVLGKARRLAAPGQ